MKLVLQRVDSAFVEVDGVRVGEISKGLVVFLGIASSDNNFNVEKIADKISRLRIFADGTGKTNLSSRDVEGGILVISQFTMMADCASNRPSFSRAASAEHANKMYDFFIECCQARFNKVASGRFATHMHVNVENDGPFTLFLEG